MSDAGLRAVARALTDARPERLGVAVSGGGDSMALLAMTLEVAECPVEAVTVNHGLRPEAAEEAGMVTSFCDARGIAHRVLHWNWDGQGNLQAEARRGRYGLIAGWALERGIDAVALGHTQDDVAETFLMRLARGSGIDGLSAMPRRFRRDGMVWLRPLLDAGREECRASLVARGIQWAEDPSNEDPAFDRVRARRALSELGIDAERLAQTSHRVAAARRALDEALQPLIREAVTEDRGDLVLPPLDPDSELHRRLLVSALRWIGGSDYPARAEAVMRLMHADRAETLAGCVLLPCGAGLRVTRELQAVTGLRCDTGSLWDGRWRLDGPGEAGMHVAALDEGITACPDWRATGLPRSSLQASPAIWQGDRLIAAPLAGRLEGWQAIADGRGNFAEFCRND